MVYCITNADFFFGIYLGNAYDLDKEFDDLDNLEIFVEKTSNKVIKLVSTIMGDDHMDYFLAVSASHYESSDGEVIEIKSNFSITAYDEVDLNTIYSRIQEKYPKLKKIAKQKWYLVSTGYSSG